jgi:hypothetical protein
VIYVDRGREDRHFDEFVIGREGDFGAVVVPDDAAVFIALIAQRDGFPWDATAFDEMA